VASISFPNDEAMHQMEQPSMNKTYGCAPVYCTGATLFFIGGSLLIYYGYPVIGAITLLPGLILVSLACVAWITFSRIKSGVVGVKTVKDKELTTQLKKPQHARDQSKTRKRK
jgi:hypothetical protein